MGVQQKKREVQMEIQTTKVQYFIARFEVSRGVALIAVRHESFIVGQKASGQLVGTFQLCPLEIFRQDQQPLGVGIGNSGVASQKRALAPRYRHLPS